jgi:N-acetyltransferase
MLPTSPSPSPSSIARPILTGPQIQLRVMQESDAAALVAAASDGELWNLPFTIVPSALTVDAYIETALKGYRAGTVLPLVTELRTTGQIIGSTRFWKIDRNNCKVEIGHTWIATSWQRSFVNTEAKYLMLSYAFDELHCVRVQFQTDEINAKSRAAILRLGAKEEGVIRHERIMPDGRKRNSVRFSIIDDEWPAVKSNLEARVRR